MMRGPKKKSVVNMFARHSGHVVVGLKVPQSPCTYYKLGNCMAKGKKIW